jgi:hypothetical protein
MDVYGWFFLAGGLFSLAGGVANWNWFMENRKARFFVKIFTRTGARIFYIVLGAVIALYGALRVAGVISG